MQSFKSGGMPSQQVLSDIKDILEVMGDPDKSKKAIDELSTILSEAIKVKSDCAEKLNSILEKRVGLENELKQMEAQALLFAEKEKVIAEKNTKLINLEAELHNREQKLYRASEDFGAEKAKAEAEIKERFALLDKKHQEAAELSLKAEAAKKDFEEKLRKMNSL